MTLRSCNSLIELTLRHVFNGLAWVFVADADGRLGWIPEVYLLVSTPTSTPTDSLIPTAENLE